LLRNENNSAIIAQSTPHYQAWVWTCENIGNLELEELANDFNNLFLDRSSLSFISKPEIADFLAKSYATKRKMSYKIIMCMEAYHCPKIIFSKQVKCEISKATLEDTDVIADFLVGFNKEFFGNDTTHNDNLDKVKQFIQSGNLYVLKVDDKIISKANIAHRSERHARIDEVYTSPLQRGKGYAGALVAQICKIIKSENQTPMLYTDLSNPSSNKAYKNVGFVECGKVNEVKFLF
jgi:predicted GNAT family acetyltransferase